MTSFVEDLNERYFDGGLSASVMAELASINDERDEVREFVARVFRLMNRQRIDAADFSELFSWLISSFVPQMLPGGWRGLVPPITVEGRHVAIDDYVRTNPWRALEDGEQMLDLGCGFPPLTAVDTAVRFPNVSITAADPSFGRFLVRDSNGDYACFDAEQRLLYWQAGEVGPEPWEKLYADPAATEARFRAHLEAALPGLPSDPDAYGKTLVGGVSVSKNPVVEFARDNLRFAEQGIGSDGLSGFQVVRCMNVLIYFDRDFRHRALEWLAGVMADGGIFIAGMNWTQSRNARYSVYQKDGDSVVPREFAFGIDNIRAAHLVPWFVLHDDDFDALALTELVRTLRGDDDFRSDFDARLDDILAGLNYCARRDDGYLGGLPEDGPEDLFETAIDKIATILEHDGFAERAVDVLRAAGYDAWVNCIGHVAVDPRGLDV